MQDFKKLAVWQRSHVFVLDVYRASALFPREEQFGLTSQLRRAASSIPANIAEGCGRDGNAELTRFLRIAAGSASEVDYHLLLAKDLGFLADQTYSKLGQEVAEIRRMLAGLQRTLVKRPGASNPALRTED